MSFSWDWFINLHSNDSIDHVFRGGWEVEPDSNWEGPLICSANVTEQNCAKVTDRRAYNDTLSTIRTMKPNLMFLYLGKCKTWVPNICKICMSNSNMWAKQSYVIRNDESNFEW